MAPRFMGGRLGDMISSDTGGGDGIYSSSDQYHKARKGAWVAEGLSATGGTTTTPGNGYKYHFFTSPGTFTVSSRGNLGGTIDYVLIAGGGGGGYDDGGGGGAGGYVENLSYITSVGDYPITIGAGGAGGANPSPNTGVDGGNSVAFAHTMIGGGGGGGSSSNNGRPGGSGGGERTNGTAGAGQNYPGPTQQGFPGGHPTDFAAPISGGGGGAGGTGTWTGPSGDTPGADGGPGKAAFSGDTGIPPSYGTPGPSAGRWFAGGGAGGGRTPAASQGGVGGGGNLHSDGTANTGGGGGGGKDNQPPDGNGGAGGSGICIVRYQV